MRMVDLIEKKRDGKILSKEEIDFIIEGYTDGSIPDYQMSALLMAIFYQDMTDEEISHLTLAMANSGDIIDLSSIDGIKVDKHSTGGVGDTTTLVLAPLVASVGVPVAKMSGRGLGFTGGTLDKFESIPGFKIELSDQEFIDIVNKSKVAVIGQSGNLAAADKKLYALRDVTATVDSIPLIASSIMSKKIAAGADAIVLDVTTGDGAFMKDIEDAKRLAKTMVRIGKLAGRQTMAVISNMSGPLGEAIGNALEIEEAIATLKGEGPEDLTELCYVLGSKMIVAANKASSFEEARHMLKTVIEDGSALQLFKEMIEAQGGDGTIVDDPKRLPQATYTSEVLASQDGYIEKIIANDIGVAAMLLGAGRATKEDEIDMAVGLRLHKKIGDVVKKGESLVTIYSNKEDVTTTREKIERAIQISATKVEKQPLIFETIGEA